LHTQISLAQNPGLRPQEGGEVRKKAMVCAPVCCDTRLWRPQSSQTCAEFRVLQPYLCTRKVCTRKYTQLALFSHKSRFKTPVMWIYHLYHQLRKKAILCAPVCRDPRLGRLQLELAEGYTTVHCVPRDREESSVSTGGNFLAQLEPPATGWQGGQLITNIRFHTC
jgi:hypothetical protein